LTPRRIKSKLISVRCVGLGEEAKKREGPARGVHSWQATVSPSGAVISKGAPMEESTRVAVAKGAPMAKGQAAGGTT
jgi:hypothetical protein